MLGGVPVVVSRWDVVATERPSVLLSRDGDASFEGGRANLAECGMTPPLVIEHLDVIKQRHLGVAEAVEAIGELALHG